MARTCLIFDFLMAASNHVYNHASNKGSEGKSCDSASTNGKRRRSKEPDDHEDTWTEHTSSSGRTYYYNKRLDKSQWERPKGMLKRSVYSSHLAEDTLAIPLG